MSIPPGIYTVTAEMPGFQTTTRTDVETGINAMLRLNFELEVAGVATQIEVSTSAADLLLESSSSTGTVMNSEVVKDLPLLGNDLMQLINTMGGVVKAENTIFGNSDQTFAGVMAGDINITRDGITVSDVRYGSGIVSPGRLNPEMVGEFKLVLTPVDAEMGRGAGQVQVLTKSGGNEYHGSGVWSVLNTALDANEWDNNRTGAVQDWKNVNQYTLSVGGPIIKNKTFFFATWDHNIVTQRETVTANTLTPCARKGIYRYFSGWNNGNSNSTTNPNGVPVRPVVDDDGMPLTPATNPDGTDYTGSLVYGSVLGQLTPDAMAQIAADPYDCSQFDFGMGNTGVIPGTNWDPYRSEYDASGYIDKFTALQPMPNYYGAGDGLNTAGFRWTRTTHGKDTIYGSGMDSARKSITVKIDHNINTEHRLSGTYSYESSFSDTQEALWPDGYGGAVDRKPQTFTVTLTSTLKPTLLNEARFGLAYNINHGGGAIDNPKVSDQVKGLMQELLPTSGFSGWPGLPILVTPGDGGFRFQPGNGGSHFFGGRNIYPARWGSQDYRWTIGDTVTWTRGSHSFKFGGEVRLTKANSDMNGWGQFGNNSPNWYPVMEGGSTTNSEPEGLADAADYFPGLVGNDSGSDATGTYGGIYSLMNYMAGSLGVVRQFYFINDPFADTWSDPTTPEGQTRFLSINQNELSFFFKDDWKVNSDLTLNLGLRYEYYGVPWMLNGMTVGMVGGAENLFGGTSGGFQEWLQGVPDFDEDNLTEQQFIGPDSPNPDQNFFEKDLNNFGPAVGFAWQLPWFGRGKTTLRGGYQVSFLNISRMDPNGGFMNVAGSQPGLLYPHQYGGDNVDYPYMDISMASELVPTSKFWDGSIEPLAVRPVTDGTQSVSVYDPNVRSPYVQSLTMALTRQIGSSLTVDVRYIGTLSRKQMGTVDLNQENWIKNGLKDELDIVRAGGESDLINNMIGPYRLWLAASGSEQLRTYPGTSTALATGNYQTVAYALGTENGLIPTPSGVQGQLLRSSGLFPENFIFTNPQFSSANWLTNLNHTNYHSLQGQVTLRPTHGLNFQATYTWSRNLGIAGNTDPLNRALDYRILSNHRSHMLTTYGTYNLPMGANGYLFRDSSGWVKKLVEGWQLSWISSLTSGLPNSVSTVNSMWGGSAVDLVRPDLFDTKGGHVTWEPGSRYGLFYGDMYTQVDDPQCDNVAAGLENACRNGLNALALASDPETIVFQKAQPGTRGNFDNNQLTGPGRWGLDLAMSKNVEFMEGKSINFRVDVNNIFNHPTPSNAAPASYDSRTYQITDPQFGLNATQPFGYIGYKTSHRVFSAKVRINF
jgi:hypothetical protein